MLIDSGLSNANKSTHYSHTNLFCDLHVLCVVTCFRGLTLDLTFTRITSIQWKKKFFVLKGRYLLYFQSEMDFKDVCAECKKEGTQIQDTKSNRLKSKFVFAKGATVRDSSAKDFCFEVLADLCDLNLAGLQSPKTGKAAMLVITAQSAAEKDAWVAALNSSISMSQVSVSNPMSGGGGVKKTASQKVKQKQPQQQQRPNPMGGGGANDLFAAIKQKKAGGPNDLLASIQKKKAGAAGAPKNDLLAALQKRGAT